MSPFNKEFKAVTAQFYDLSEMEVLLHNEFHGPTPKSHGENNSFTRCRYI